MHDAILLLMFCVFAKAVINLLILRTFAYYYPNVVDYDTAVMGTIIETSC